MPKSASLTHSAYERLRNDILTCRAQPGQRMNIVEWAQRLDVNPTAVREALSRLTAEELVVAEPQRGFHVAAISASDLRQLTDARIAIEELVLRRAIALGDEAWEARVVAAEERMAKVPERASEDAKRLGEPWSKAHAAFHQAVLSTCDNKYLLQLRDQLYTKSERYRRLSIPLAKRERDVASEHRAIAEAALRRDADRAAMLTTSHIAATTRIVLRALFPKDAVSPERARSSL